MLTVNPFLIAGKRMSTQRSLVTALDQHADLVVATAGDYDFARGLVRAYRRTRGGKFEALGMIAPAADLWIVYSDGYYLDHRVRGFARRRDFFDAQIEFHERAIAAGRIGRMINAPTAEARTLKSWLAHLSAAEYRVIPTHVLSSIDEVYTLLRNEGAIVAKPEWGGAGNGVYRLLGEGDVQGFERRLAEAGSALSDYCFQPYRPGDETRMWFVGGRFVTGRKCRGRKTPWSDSRDDYEVFLYDASEPGFAAKLAAAERLCARAELDVGAIDFIGESINEINGCGTVFTEYQHWRCIVDARPALVRYLVDLLPTL
jgi:hypothetical protein